MRIVLQRVSTASVAVEGKEVASIGRGLLLLVGIAQEDDKEEARRMAAKCAEMRIFSDEAGRFNLSLLDIRGEALIVSQFTLLADVRRGRRPSFARAAPPPVAEPIVEAFTRELAALGVRVETGRFGAMMQVGLVNDGPVTIVLDSADLDRPRRR
jgi:D-tyrosyl-tRNA(Tyr) deacylase